MSPTPSPTLSPPTAAAAPSLRVLSIGMGWQPEQPGNGLDRVYHALATHLPDAGVDVRGVVVGSPAVASSSGGRVAAFGPEAASLPGRLRTLRRAVRARLAEAPVDLVATHFALHTAPVLDLIRAHPLVVHFHGPWAQESAVEGESAWKVRVKAAVERLVYRRGTRCVVLSKAFRRVLVEDYGVDESRIQVIPGGTDVAHFRTGVSRAAARARLDWPADRPTVLAVRRLVPRMGLENLVGAAHRLRAAVPDALLLVAGKGPLAPALTARIEAEGLSDTVRLLGYVPDALLPYAYRAADLTVVPTVALEGFGLITVESLAAGTPALVTPVGGLPETVRGLSPRLVLPDASVEGLSAGLIGALTGTLPLPSDEECRAYAHRHFNWPAVARRVHDVYAAAVQDAPSSSGPPRP